MAVSRRQHETASRASCAGWQHTFKPVLDYISTIVPADLWVKYDLELQLVAEPIIGAEMTAELRGIHRVAQNELHETVTVRVSTRARRLRNPITCAASPG